VHKSLQKHGFSVGALHGDMDQSARTAALDQFRKGEIPLLVASDVAARGLDIPAVSHIFNFDVPHHADDYVHRIGRTGRAGRTGTAISLVTPLDQKSMAAIEKLIGQDIPRAEGDFSVAAESSHEERPRGHRGREGSRDGSPGGRKPRREREPRHAKDREPRQQSQEREPRPASHEHEPRQQTTGKRHHPKTQPETSSVPSIGRAQAPRRPRDADSEPADHSHLPAFLLRPVRDRVS
jgi:superfamily II DNA/RNA helicase